MPQWSSDRVQGIGLLISQKINPKKLIYPSGIMKDRAGLEDGTQEFISSIADRFKSNKPLDEVYFKSFDYLLILFINMKTPCRLEAAKTTPTPETHQRTKEGETFIFFNNTHYLLIKDVFWPFNLDPPSKRDNLSRLTNPKDLCIILEFIFITPRLKPNG